MKTSDIVYIYQPSIGKLSHYSEQGNETPRTFNCIHTFPYVHILNDWLFLLHAPFSQSGERK